MFDKKTVFRMPEPPFMVLEFLHAPTASGRLSFDYSLKHAARYAKVTGVTMENAVDIITVSINTGMVTSAQRATDVLVALGDAADTDSRMAA